jgi:hypothetical protein
VSFENALATVYVRNNYFDCPRHILCLVGTNVDSDYNTFVSPLVNPFILGGVEMGFATWQAAGHDLHSTVI